MGVRETYRAGNGAGRRSQCRYGLRIVRTLVFPHAEVSGLITDIGSALGPAFEPDKGEKGVVLLESRALLCAIKDRRGSVDRRMLAEAETELKEAMRRNNLGQTPIDVTVDPRKPLKMFGRHKDVLALNIRPDMRLGSDRGAIETFVDEFYPSEQELGQRAKPLEPHVTLGKIKPQFLDYGSMADFEEDAVGMLNSPAPDMGNFERLLFRPAVVIPREVALNGLRISVEADES